MKARQNLGEVLEEVYYKGNQYVIQRARQAHGGNRARSTARGMAGAA